MYNYGQPMNQPMRFSPSYEIIHVTGENGAKAFQMPPNSSVLLLDDTNPIIWVKVTDGAGFPTLTPYAITEYHPAPPIDVSSLEARIKNLEAKLNESNHTEVKSEELQPIT